MKWVKMAFSALQAGGHWFESSIAHKNKPQYKRTAVFFTLQAELVQVKGR
jgi:hypothetical protein